jgi:hypothetical protein
MFNNNNKQTTIECGGMFTFGSIEKTTKMMMATCKVSEKDDEASSKRKKG